MAAGVPMGEVGMLAEGTAVGVAGDAHAEMRAAEHSSVAMRVARSARRRAIERAIIVDVRAAAGRRFPAAEG
jgi:hypothetical protein